MEPSKDNAEERSMKGNDSDFEFALEKQLKSVETAPPHNARRVWLKMDLYVLPIVVMFYFLSFLVSTLRTVFEVQLGAKLILGGILGPHKYRKCSCCGIAAATSHD